MDVLSNVTEHIYSLPVALILQNGSGLDGNGTPANVSNKPVYSYRRAELLVSPPGGVPQKAETLGDTLRKELKWAFILHTYGFGCLFFILAFYTFFSILNIRSFISSRPFMSTINGFLCLLGTSRAASLFIDPYNLKENMPKLIGQVLWDLGFPSIISAFCLVQLAFLQLTQLKIGPEGLRRKSCLSLIVTAHFLVTIGMDIIVASHEHLTIVKHVIQYIFLTWGVFLCSTFLYSGYKVMSMIRSIPGGFKHRDLPDPSYKGIMQLAILAPHNNLAGSMTAALLPTLCTPKIHQQDNVNLSSVGFRNEGNSRILESESIPMLEEMTASSGDETSSKPLARGSSFQNQTRNSQKFNLKPKLSLRSVSDNEEEGSQEKQAKQKSPKSPKSPTVKNQSPKRLHLKSTEFDFNMKTGNGILKNTENFVTTRSIHEFKSKIQHRTSFENENFHFPHEKKSQVNNSTSADNLIPDILISCPSNSEQGREAKQQGKDLKGEKNQENLTKIMKEITKDLNEMQIVREDKTLGADPIVEVHKAKPHPALDAKGDATTNQVTENRTSDSSGDRRGSQVSRDDSRRNSSREESITPSTPNTRRESSTPEITKYDETPILPQKMSRRRKTKSLSWKKKEVSEEEENATQECLLPQENPTDVSLRAVLNHIAYMNRGPPSNVNNEDEMEKIRKSKVEWVLNITYITAMWGLMLCLSNMGRIYSPFEVPESRKPPLFNVTQVSDTGNGEDGDNGIFFSSWPWLWFQTFCRALELAMGCAMANITRQPTANHRYPRALSLRHRDTLYSM